MKQFPLTRNLVSFVDDEDYERLVNFRRRWQSTKRKYTNYAKCHEFVRYLGKGVSRYRIIYMHRWLLGLEANDGHVVDHIDGNGLNNCRANLRIVSQGDNVRNRVNAFVTKTGFSGVAVVGDNFRAYVTDSTGAQEHLGCWSTALLAASARDHFVRRNYPLTRPNFPDGPPHSEEDVLRAKVSTPAPSSGHKMIREHAGKWEAYYRKDGRRIYIGRFEGLEEAREAQRIRQLTWADGAQAHNPRTLSGATGPTDSRYRVSDRSQFADPQTDQPHPANDQGSV